MKITFHQAKHLLLQLDRVRCPCCTGKLVLFPYWDRPEAPSDDQHVEKLWVRMKCEAHGCAFAADMHVGEERP